MERLQNRSSSVASESHNWTIYNDSKSCSLSFSNTTLLKLTGSTKEEFTCSDGSCMHLSNLFTLILMMLSIIRSCVHMTDRCNGVNDCTDETDEEDCEAFVRAP